MRDLARSGLKHTKSGRAPKIARTDLDSAIDFLENDPIGRRLRAAEYALTLLLKNQLPRLKQYIFNATFDLREISNGVRFDKLFNSIPALNDLLKESKSRGHIKVNFDKDRIRIVLFYERGLSRSEALLYSKSLGEIVAVTYATLGLDMTGLIPGNATMDNDKEETK